MEDLSTSPPPPPNNPIFRAPGSFPTWKLPTFCSINILARCTCIFAQQWPSAPPTLCLFNSQERKTAQRGGGGGRSGAWKMMLAAMRKGTPIHYTFSPTHTQKHPIVELQKKTSWENEEQNAAMQNGSNMLGVLGDKR